MMASKFLGDLPPIDIRQARPLTLEGKQTENEIILILEEVICEILKY